MRPPMIDLSPPKMPWEIVGVRTIMPRTTPRYRVTRYPSTVNVVVMVMLMGTSLPEHDAGEGASVPMGGAGELAVLLRGHQGPVRWWRPSIVTMIRELEVWWLLVVAVGAALVAGGIALVPILGCFGTLLSNAVLLGVAELLAARSRAIRRGMAARRGPFCIHCGYSLRGLSDHGSCPECGMAYSLNIVNDFRRDPDWFIRRFEMIRQELKLQEAAAMGQGR